MLGAMMSHLRPKSAKMRDYRKYYYYLHKEDLLCEVNCLF